MCAILLSGSRGAVLALAAGLCLLAAMLRPRLRAVAKMVAFAVLAIEVFYFSPAGGRLRARAHWIGEDRAGGARPLLWRDSLRMAVAKPLVGFGLDTFVADFPRYQSEELARAYPDFDHESPHNIFLDALTEEGLPGLFLLVAVIGAGLAGGWSGRTQALSGHSMLAETFLPGLVASLVAHQFVVFVGPTAFYFYLGAGMLAGAGEPESVGLRLSAAARWTVLGGGLAAAGFLVVMACRLVIADSTLELVDRRLDANDARGAADAYRKALERSGQGVAADLYFSRRWAWVAGNTADSISKLYYDRLAFRAASVATKSPERQQNAWYNLAIFEASTGNVPAVEYSLRASIAVAPVWYKPHWALARLLAKEGRPMEAEREARRALYLDGGKDAEVVSTLNEIFGSGAHSP